MLTPLVSSLITWLHADADAGFVGEVVVSAFLSRMLLFSIRKGSIREKGYISFAHIRITNIR